MLPNRITTFAAVLALAATACGGGGDEVSAGSGEPAATTATVIASTATSEATTTSQATTTTTTTTTATTTTTTTAAPGCEVIPLPDGAEVGDSYSLDIDGDGAEDTVTVYFDPSQGVGNSGLFVEYASGGSTLLPRPVFSGRHGLIPIGLHDVQGDGTAELFVLEYLPEEGVSYEPGVFTNNIFVAAVGDCTLTTERGNTGFGQLFTIATYPPQGVHLVCEEGQLRRYDYYQDAGGDSSAFSVSISPYVYTSDGWDLDFDNTARADIPKDEMLARPLLDCGDLELPAPIPAG